MRNISILLIILIIALLAFFTFTDWTPYSHPSVIEEQPVEDVAPARDSSGDMTRAQQALNRGQAQLAQDIAEKYADLIEAQTPAGKRWGHILVDAATETKDVGQLQVLYYFSPTLLLDNEKACLLVAENFLAAGDLEEYDMLRSKAKDTEQNVWTILDSDRLLLEGDRKGANNLLSARTFEGSAEVDRLVRLALINISDDPKTAWRYFSRAEAKDPHNPEIHFFKGKLLETAGKYRKAQAEYEAAVATDPQNSLMLDQLAEFYMRQNQPLKAVELWTSNLDETTADFIWFKGLFWSKVLAAAPKKVTGSPPQGKIQPLLAYLSGLPQGTFWNKTRFNTTAYNDYEMTYWLRLLQALKDNNVKDAVAIQNETSISRGDLNPELEFLFKQILSYQTKGKFDTSSIPRKLSLGSQARHPFISQMESLAQNPGEEPSPELKSLLLSSEAFSAALLATGWTEAALQLHKETVYPSSFPSWVAVDMTRALQDNRTPDQALDFAVRQPQTPDLLLAVGELKISIGDETGALETLKSIVQENNSIGYNAAWLAALLYLEQHQPNKAKEVIYNQPLLYNDVKGKETLARVSIMEGNKLLAEEIYEKISDNSEEAKSYLAKQAFLNGDWEKAKRLTRQLLKLHPNNPQLHKNLERIITEQNQTLNSNMPTT